MQDNPSYESLLGLFTNAAIGMVICDIEGRFIDCNPHFAFLTGYSREELSSMTFKDITHPDDLNSDLQLLKELIRGERENFQLEKRYITKQKETIWVNLLAAILKGSDKQPKRIIGTIEDITERKTISLELEKSKSNTKRVLKLLKSIQDAIPDLIGVQDLEHNIIQYNKAGYKLLNKTHEETVGKKCYMLIGRKGECEVCSTSRAIETGKPAGHQKFFPELDAWFDIRAYPIFNDDNEIIYVVEHLRDITDMKQLELELKKTIKNLKEAKLKAEESDNLKTAFLHNISHEIRTPLNGIIGFSSLLKDENFDSERIDEYVSTIIRSGYKLSNIINNIVSIATIESGQEKVNLAPTDLQKLLEDIASDYKLKARERGLSYYFTNNTGSEKYITTDETKLYQILSNLLSNAIKFTSAGYIEFSASKNDGELAFTVKDTGIGIKDADKEVIFERFNQVSSDKDNLYDGSGLGLSISKAYAKLLGGEIRVESVFGKGSAFHLRIPYEKNLAVSNNIPLKEKENDCKTILIAEDDEINFLYLDEILKSLDLNTLHAKNGREAVELCEGDQTLDLILMDIKMPEMDGHEATRKIKQIRPDVPIIAVSAYFEEKEKHISRKMGCIDYLTKPVQKQDILDSILNVLRMKI